MDTKPTLALPEHSILADKVYDSIRDALVAQRIAPGARMNLADLARSLHVSNTPVRQALARLESEGLVTREPYRGYTATPLLDARAIAELYDARLLIEPVSAGRAARTPDARHLDTLRELCDKDAVAQLLDDTDQNQLGQRDCALHVLISEMSGNSVLAGVVGDLLERSTRYTLYHQRSAAEDAWDEHRAVVEAIVAKDSRGAAKAMTDHLKGGLERMRSALG